MIKQAAVDRRTFLKRSLQASGALVIHFNFNTSALANSQIKQAQDKQVSHANGTIFPNAWLEITPDNQLIFTLDKAEIGQNVITSLTAIIAEELDIDYQQLITRFPTLGKNPSHPTYQPSWGTGGSSSISSLWQPLRHAGAATKTLFSAAAAQHWDTSIDKLYHKNAVVFLKDSKKTITYAELITLAKNIDTPSYQLKPSTDFTQLGKPLIRYDAKAKVTGTATYGMDIDFPNLKYASLIRAPKLGWQIKTFDTQRAKQATGVLDIVRISNGIAIIAESYWQAHSARNLLEVHWQKTSPSHQYDDQTINTALNHSLNTKGLSARKKGESLTTHAANQDNHSNQQHLTATYSAPLLAHTPMDPPLHCILVLLAEVLVDDLRKIMSKKWLR